MAANLRIGEVLAERGYVTQEQIQKALDYQKEHRDMRFGQILMKLEFVTENQVLEALASRLGLEIVDVTQMQVDIDAVSKLDKEFAQKNMILPVNIQNGMLLLVTNDPLNYFALEEVRQRTGCYIQIMLSEEQPLSQAISYYFAEARAKMAASTANESFEGEIFNDVDLSLIGESDDETPVIRLVNTLIDRAIRSNASDVHIEPFDNETKVRMRIDGVIMDYVTLQRTVHQPLVARIKIMANMDIAEKRIPQDGHFRVNSEIGYVNIRVSVIPTVFGEKAVMRILASAGKLDHADKFGMDEYTYQRFLPMLSVPNGIIYVTGPTGSGKSTTLYMILEYLRGRMVNISTIGRPCRKKCY